MNGRAAKFSIERLGDVQRPRLARGGRGQAVAGRHPLSPRQRRLPAPSLPETGSRNTGLRILRSRADESNLRLLLEGRSGTTYTLGARSTRRLKGVPGVAVQPAGRGSFTLQVTFEGPPDAFVRRELVLPLE